MSSATDPVQTLLDLPEGERVTVEAQYYEFAAPLVVDETAEDSWKTPTGKVWRSRRVRLAPTSQTGGASEKELDVYTDGPAPEIGAYGPVKRVERVTEDEQDGGPDECPEWLAYDADAIVDDAPVERTLAEVLDAVERQDSLLDVHKRISGKTITRTKDLLWKLGLRNQQGGLHDDDVLDEMIAELREVYVDE